MKYSHVIQKGRRTSSENYVYWGFLFTWFWILLAIASLVQLHRRETDARLILELETVSVIRFIAVHPSINVIFLLLLLVWVFAVAAVVIRLRLALTLTAHRVRLDQVGEESSLQRDISIQSIPGLLHGDDWRLWRPQLSALSAAALLSNWPVWWAVSPWSVVLPPADFSTPLYLSPHPSPPVITITLTHHCLNNSAGGSLTHCLLPEM